MRIINYKKTGFTIAEMIVAMMIVGTIAILMIPPLISNNEKQVLMVSLQKTYTNLQDICQSIPLLIVKGVISSTIGETETNTTLTKTNTKFIKTNTTFINAVNKTQKTIDLSKETNLPEEEKYLYNYNPTLEKEIKTKTETNTAVLKNGVIIMNDGTNIVVDVNGIRKPNIVGKDIFYFESVLNKTNGNINLAPVAYDKTNCNGVPKDSTAAEHIGCADYILNYNNKMSYY